MGANVSTKVYFPQGGDSLEVAAGGAINVAEGAAVNIGGNLDCVNLDAGASGVAGSVDVFPATGSKGKLAVTCQNQTGDTTVTLTAGAMGQATTVTIPDPGGATADVVLTAGNQTIAGTKKLTGALAFETGDNDITLTPTGTNLIVTNLPTSDPAVAGALWNDNGTLKVSAG